MDFRVERDRHSAVDLKVKLMAHRKLQRASSGEEVAPSIAVAPLVGFDQAGFRLGYGGGFYDRTLASMPSKPLTIGIGF